MRTAKTNQTGRMPRSATGQVPRLIRVFAGRTYHFVGFVMRRLIFMEIGHEIISMAVSLPTHRIQAQVWSSGLKEVSNWRC